MQRERAAGALAERAHGVEEFGLRLEHARLLDHVDHHADRTDIAVLERAGLQAQRLLLNDRVELYRSLGGTWSYDVTLLRESE